jgi:ubiquinone/menaquinone biosynthesis C-methylase UbiE
LQYHRHSEEERRGWQNPERILAEVGLRPGMTFADIGCGRGFFTIPAAGIVGETGRVLASDIDGESLEILREKARNKGIKNIETNSGKAEEKVVCNNCADMVFFGQCLHDFQDPAKALKNARKTVKPGGLLVNLDWKKENMENGPPVDIRFSEEQASTLIKEAGFEVVQIIGSGPYHYIIKAKRSGSI